MAIKRFLKGVAIILGAIVLGVIVIVGMRSLSL